MPDVSLGRFSRWLEKFFNAKGGPVLQDISGFIQPVISLDRGTDHRYLEGWNRFAAFVGVAALAANFGTARLRNGAGTNVIAIIESLTYFNSGADSPSLTWGASAADLASGVSMAFTRIDPRGNPTPSLTLSSAQGAANPAIFRQLNINSGTFCEFVPYAEAAFELLPGQMIQCFANTVNTAAFFSFVWRERALESSELT